MLIKNKTIKIKIGLQKNLNFGKKIERNFLLDILTASVILKECPLFS